MTILSISQLRERVTLEEPRYVPLRDGVVALWEGVTDLKWVLNAAEIETLTPRGATIRTIALRRRPVNSITKVEERTASQAEWDELEASNYELLEGGRIERIGCYWPDRVRVTYSGGYPEGGAPADILEALLLQCEFNVRRIGGDKVGIRSQGSGVPGGGFTSFDEAYLHPTFAKLARQYRRVV